MTLLFVPGSTNRMVNVRLTLRRPHAVDLDLLLSAPSAARWRDLFIGLRGMDVGPADTSTGLWFRGRVIDDELPLSLADLHDGAVISTTRELAPRPVRDLLALFVIGGPDSGLRIALTAGAHVIGRGSECALRLSDATVSRRHAIVELSPSGFYLHDAGSTHGTYLDGHRVDGVARPLLTGQIIRCGTSLLILRGAAELNDDNSDTPHDSAPVASPTSSTLARPLPLGASLLGALIGLLAAGITHNPTFLAFALLAPAMALAGALGDRLQTRSHRLLSRARTRRRDRRGRAAVQRRRHQQLAAELRRYPPPSLLLAELPLDDARLPRREQHHPDFLRLRVGMSATSEAHAGHLDGHRVGRRVGRRGRRSAQAATAPTWSTSIVDLGQENLLLTGPVEYARGIARWLIIQALALQHAPVRVVVLSTDEGASAWRWARWLPTNTFSLHRDADARAGLLNEVRSMRVASLETTTFAHASPAENLIIVIDPLLPAAELDAWGRIAATTPAPGVGLIALGSDTDWPGFPGARLVPGDPTGAGDHTEGTTARLVRSSSGRPSLCLADRLDAPQAEQAARAVRRGPTERGASELPTDVRFDDLFGFDLTPAAITAEWRAGRVGRVPIGVAADGTFDIDLVRDGPHLLAVGSTGAGKSEFLRTLVGGLAVHSSPEELGLLLIDFKGGATFGACAQFPHTIGVVSDLDAGGAARAVSSLTAELRRREQLFARHAVADLSEFQAAVLDAVRLPRLVVVVDEFATLVDELPDVVSSLIGIARRGRSLGLHLVLVTQRAAGAVPSEIKANVALRVALRVTDVADSLDVIAAPDAARIGRRQVGRAFVRSPDGVHEVQLAHFAMPRALAPPSFTVLDEWGHPMHAPASNADPASRTAAARTAVQPPSDELERLAWMLRKVAGDLALRQPAATWLPPLPDVLPAPPVLRPGHRSVGSDLALGMLDLPEQQSQPPLIWRLRPGAGHLLAGTGGSGRTSVLRCLTDLAAHQHAAHDLEVYVLDFGGGLSDLDGLAQLVGRLDDQDFEAAARCLRRVRDRMQDTGRASDPAQRPRPDGGPTVLLLLDGWEAFVRAAEEHDQGESMSIVIQLLRDVHGTNTSVVITGGRALLTAPVWNLVPDRYVLALADAGDYSLAGLSRTRLPARLPPGRAVRVADGAIVQFYLRDRFDRAGPALGRSASDSAQAAPSAAVVGRKPLRSLPRYVSLESLQRAGNVETVDEGSRFLIGRGGDAGDLIRLDLFGPQPDLLIAGAPRTGRSSLLRTILHQSTGRAGATVVLAPGYSPMAEAARQAGTEFVDLARPAAGARWAQLAYDIHDSRTTCDTSGAGSLVSPVLILVDDHEPHDASLGLLRVLEWVHTARAAALPVALAVGVRAESLMFMARAAEADLSRRAQLVLLPGADGIADAIGLRLRERAGSTRWPGRATLHSHDPSLRSLAEPGRGIRIQLAVPPASTEGSA